MAKNSIQQLYLFVPYQLLYILTNICQSLAIMAGVRDILWWF